MWFSRKPLSPRPAAIAAAHYWGDYLRSGQNRFGSDSTSAAGDFIALMGAQAHANRPPITPAQIALFENHLAGDIEAELQRLEQLARRRAKRDTRRGSSPQYSSPPPCVTLAIDRVPEGMLAAALTAANLADQWSVFPSKSCMWVESARVSMSPGYQANAVVVWAEPSPVS